MFPQHPDSWWQRRVGDCQRAANLPVPVTLGAGALIDASGVWTNDSPAVTPEPGTSPVVVNGGTVTLSAAGNVVLGQNSLIDVSGGGWLQQDNQLQSGTAGKITLAANFSDNSKTPVADPIPPM